MLFKKKLTLPTVTEVSLSKDYAFMYQHFVVATQQQLVLLLEKQGDKIDALTFDYLLYKSGYPNDEAAHPLSEYGLGFYGLFLVGNSPWLAEIIDNNRQHSRHSDSHFAGYRHYIARFKDATIEVLCRNMEEAQLTTAGLLSLVNEQVRFLET